MPQLREWEMSLIGLFHQSRARARGRGRGRG